MMHENWWGAWWGPALPAWVGPTIALLAIWSTFWKGLALWHSAQRSQHWWFVALLLINTAGILEIIYLFLVLKLKLENLFTRGAAE